MRLWGSGGGWVGGGVLVKVAGERVHCRNGKCPLKSGKGGEDVERGLRTKVRSIWELAAACTCRCKGALGVDGMR
jgi:hypothetical protein